MRRCSSPRQALEAHQDKHPECLSIEGRSLLSMGFTRTGGDAGRTNPEMPADDDDDPIGLDRLPDDNADHDTSDLTVRVGPSPQVQPATAETGFGTGHHFWRSLTRSLDGVIKSNSTAQVIPSAEAIAAEVLRQQQLYRIEQRGTGLIRENWTEASVEADMVRDAGLSYRELDGGHSREIYCPVCHDYGRGVATTTTFYNPQRLKNLRTCISRHFATDVHRKALTEKEKERTRNLRRSRVGITIARTALQTVREGSSYMQFEEKLHNLHLAGLDIGSLNHSRQFIRAFVESMTVVMDRRIERHLHAVDTVTGRKRIFAFMADKVTELHRTGDAVALMVMSEGGELQAVFCDYLLVTGHTGEALMSDIYEKTFVKKLKLGPADIRDQCTGAAFDGQYFHLGCLEVFSRMVVEKAKGAVPTGAEVNNFWE